jgi:ribA/ribD-fused uncharacterized protein
MRITEKYTFFYGSDEVFSNWYPSPFTVGGVIFPTSEHWMMHKKALLFDDVEIAEKILAAETPREAKALGRKVHNFYADTWNQYAQSIVSAGCYWKFASSLDLLEKLLATQGTTLVEASKYDRIWGVGLEQTDDRILDPKNWKGTNWLGEVLTDLRDDALSNRRLLEGE